MKKMQHVRKLSTDMPRKEFAEALERVDWKDWQTNPHKALASAGVKLKDGIVFKMVRNDKEAANLKSHRFPLKEANKNSLGMTELQEASGGLWGDCRVSSHKHKSWWGDWCT